MPSLPSNWANLTLDSLLRSVFMFWCSLIGWCHELRIHNSGMIIQVEHKIVQLLVKPMKEAISKVFLSLAHTKHYRVFLLNSIQCPSNGVTHTVTFSGFTLLWFINSCIKISKDATVPYMNSNVFTISDMGVCRPRYQARSAAAPHEDHTIPSLNVTTLVLCIAPYTSKAHCSNETSLFWVEFPLNVMNFGVLPTTWEATLGLEILWCGFGFWLGNCAFVSSTDTLSSLPT